MTMTVGLCPLTDVSQELKGTPALVDIGAASSRSFGLSTGSNSTTKPVDGLLIIGADDSVRKQGQLTRFTNFNRCWACIIATRITYNYSNRSTSLAASTEARIQ